MQKHVELSHLNYIKGLFRYSYQEANEAIVLWDNYDEPDRGTTARDLWGEALLMAYKASVAGTKSTWGEAVSARIVQRRLMLTIETSFDAGSKVLVRFRTIHTRLVPLRAARNRRDDETHEMVPQLSPIITRAQLERFTARQKGRVKRILTR